MADKPISALTLFTSYSTADEVEILDVSDTTLAATGTNKRIQFSTLLTLAGVGSVAGGGTGLTAAGSADQLLGVAHTGGALEYKRLTAGSNITITPAAGAINIATPTCVLTAGSSTLPTTIEIHPDPSLIVVNGTALTAAVATGKHVLLYPGTYHLVTGTLTLATEGQCVAGVPGGEKTVHIQTAGPAVITQTAAVVHLRNLLIDDDPSTNSTGLHIDVAGDNANAGSTYDHLSFINCGDGISAFHLSTTDVRHLSGVWSWISNPNGAILRAPYGQILNGFVATDIVGGTLCVYTRERDNSSGTQSVDFNGRVQRFVCGDQFLGCSGLAGNVGPLAVITDGTCGNKSIALGASIQAGAVIQRVTCGYASIAGSAGYIGPYAATTDGTGAKLTISGYNLPTPLRNSMVGMTVYSGTGLFAQITQIINAGSKIVGISPAWASSQSYSVTMMLEGTNAGLIEDVTYAFSSSEPSLAQGPAYAANNGIIRRATSTLRRQI